MHMICHNNCQDTCQRLVHNSVHCTPCPKESCSMRESKKRKLPSSHNISLSSYANTYAAQCFATDVLTGMEEPISYRFKKLSFVSATYVAPQQIPHHVSRMSTIQPSIPRLQANTQPSSQCPQAPLQEHCLQTACVGICTDVPGKCGFRTQVAQQNTGPTGHAYHIPMHKAEAFSRDNTHAQSRSFQ